MLEDLNKTVRDICSYIERALIVELELQGHRATGELIRSLRTDIYSRTNIIVAEGRMAHYGRYVDTERKKGSYVPINALMRWIRVKGIEQDLKKVKSLAFAIQRKIFNVGISTPESWRGESTKDFLTKTLKNVTPKVNEDISNAVTGMVDVQFSNMIQECKLIAKQMGIAA